MSVIQDIENKKVFLGHPKEHSNPKTRDAWMGVHGSMVIFDPKILEDQLKKAKEIVKDAKTSNKEVLVICEKEVYKWEVETLAEKAWFHYLNHKIPAWVLTNFDTLLWRIKSLRDMRRFVDSDAFATLTKKEQSMKKRALAKVEKVYKWVINLRKRPEMVIIVDGQMMHKFVEEVEALSIPAVVLISSDFDMFIDAHCVMCNVNSQQSIDYVLRAIAT